MLKSYITVQPIPSAGAAASRYIPLVLLNRLLAFVRLLVVTRLLGEAGKAQFGMYQPALELINWFVPLALMGLGEVIERYAAGAVSAGQLQQLLRSHARRLLLTSCCVVVAGAVLAPWLAQYLLPAADHHDAVLIVFWALINVLLLAGYQYLLGLLRGLRAYGSAAFMESIAAVLLLVLSAGAAMYGGAVLLLAAYAASNGIPALYFLLQIIRYCRTLNKISPDNSAENLPSRHRFATAAFIRLMLMMTYGYAIFWAVGWVMRDSGSVAEFAAPWRVAQLIVYVAATIWSSTYGLIVTSWSHGARKRARRQLVTVGRMGICVLLLAGTLLLLLMPLWQAVFPLTYHAAFLANLKIMISLFVLHSMLMYVNVWCDLYERPDLGAMLWGCVLIVAAIMLSQYHDEQSFTPILGAAWSALAASLFVFSWGVMTVLGVRHDYPIAGLTLSSLFFVLPGYYAWLVPLLTAILFLFFWWYRRRLPRKHRNTDHQRHNSAA